MSRFPFGGGVSDWTFATVDGINDIDNLAQVVGDIAITFWTAEVGGTQHTDLIGPDGQPTTTITSTPDGVVGGRAVGQIPPLQGPDGVKRMWAQAATGPRALMVTTDPGADDLGLILPPLSVPGTATAPATGRARLYNDTAATLLVAAVRASVGSPPTIDTIIDVNRNGTSIFSTPGNRPVIAAGDYTSGKVVPLDLVLLAPEDYLTADIDTGAGWTHLVVQVLATRAA
ncbi:hypothetical protein [Actinoplanes sp. NPDC049118]|uniref:hypothetical protein n=1 Tax=Actinoplanes sp. NPDC049118 TaxID=3155769 RepID=UPI0033FCC25A